MRILMVTDLYPPVLGGMERHVQRLSRELVARGHDVTVATFAIPGSPAEETDEGVTIHRIRGLVQSLGKVHGDSRRPFAPPFPDPKATFALRKLLRSNTWDVVHCHNWLIHSLLPVRALSNAAFVFTLHDYGLACVKKTLFLDDAPCAGPAFSKCLTCAIGTYGAVRGLPTALGNRVMQSPLRLGVDLFLPVSQSVADGTGLAARRLPFRVIPNFISDDLLSDAPTADSHFSQLPDREFVLFVGGLDRTKGLDVLLRAYAELQDAPPLVIIGASRSGGPGSLPPLPPNAIVLRDWPEAAVRGAWRRSVMGIVPSVWAEPCPTVVLEAMAAGRAVVGSRIGGIPELIVDGETGALVPAGDVCALRRSIQDLLERPDLRQRMGQAARARVVHFTSQAVVPEVERTYRQLRETRCLAA
ncbi:MAG: glycosyltransferase family 4 protein [Chloroflexi bacterium]|nr:glycosyltransferase family 4 protein [Chloroflexota bacterium]